MLYSHKEWKSLCCKHLFILNMYAITMYYCIYITYNSNFFCSVCQSILLSGTFPVQCRPIWNACLHPHKSCCIPSPDLETLGQQQWEGTYGHAGGIQCRAIVWNRRFLIGWFWPFESKFMMECANQSRMWYIQHWWEPVSALVLCDFYHFRE